MSLCDLVKDAFALFLWVTDKKRARTRCEIWGTFRGTESTSVIYRLPPPSGQSVSLLARNNSEPSLKAKAVINSHLNQWRCLGATKQPKGPGGLLAWKPSKMTRSLFSCQEESLKGYSVLSNIYKYLILYNTVVTGSKLKDWPSVLSQKHLLIFSHRSSRRLNVTQQTRRDTHHIASHDSSSSQHRGFLKRELHSASARVEYLCSCFHPRGRHSSVCRCTPEKCWCTCCCGRRTHCLNRVLKHKHMYISSREIFPLPLILGQSRAVWLQVCH